jgi:ubiquinol-cytochrome c reductase cytochrome c subunit
MRRTDERVRTEVGFSIVVVCIVAVSFVAALLVEPTTSQVSAQESSGADLYTTQCAGCHQPEGEGIEGTFPPLAGNPAATDTEYVGVVIVDGKSGPLDVLGVSYDSVMPAISGLSDDEVTAISDHVVQLAGGGSEPDQPDTPDEPDQADEPAAPADPPTAGDIDRGRDLFTGSQRLDNGGGACASCHTAGDVGNLGGSSLGPDLTDVYDRFGGEAGTSAWLANPASPTMIPIFGDKPLTEAEIDDIVAFLADAPDQEQPSDTVDWLTLAALVGVLLLLGGMAIAWRGMRQTYAQTLRSRR